MNEHDEVAAHFRARVNLHLRRDWTIVFSHTSRLDVTLTKRVVGCPRTRAPEVTIQATTAAAAHRVSFRRIYVDRDNQVQVRLVAGLPEY